MFCQCEGNSRRQIYYCFQQIRQKHHWAPEMSAAAVCEQWKIRYQHRQSTSEACTDSNNNLKGNKWCDLITVLEASLHSSLFPLLFFIFHIFIGRFHGMPICSHNLSESKLTTFIIHQNSGYFLVEMSHSLEGESGICVCLLSAGEWYKNVRTNQTHL